MGSQKMENWEEAEEGFEDKRERCESFVVDIESLSNSNGTHKDINANSRITLQRNLSRKASQRGERKITSPRETTFGVVGDGSPKGAGSTPEKPSIIVNMVGVANIEDEAIMTTTPQHVITCSGGEGKSRRYGTQRSTWTDPWQILLFFATLSSMGTIILIYFTFSVGKLNGDG